MFTGLDAVLTAYVLRHVAVWVIQIAEYSTLSRADLHAGGRIDTGVDAVRAERAFLNGTWLVLVAEQFLKWGQRFAGLVVTVFIKMHSTIWAGGNTGPGPAALILVNQNNTVLPATDRLCRARLHTRCVGAVVAQRRNEHALDIGITTEFLLINRRIPDAAWRRILYLASNRAGITAYTAR